MSEAIKRKNEVVEVEETPEVTPMERPPFMQRFAEMGAMIRNSAKEFLKFDSQVDSIDYVYVDTQQYKELLGKCADSWGIGVIYNANDPTVQIQTDSKGVMVFVATVDVRVRFFDPFGEDKEMCSSACGMGVSRGSGFALGVAQTNAMRNLITNTFMLPTSDRESDDVKGNIEPQKFLTDENKADKRAALLEKTKSASQYASVQYGRVLYNKIQEVLAKDIPADFRAKLDAFVSTKFKGDEPISQDDDANLWIVKKVSANAIMTDLDEYN